MKQLSRALVVLVSVVLIGACSKADESPDALMKTGLEALNVKRDPQAAVVAFRKVLEKNPSHYGANFQLALALDRAGKPAEAIPQWEKALQMADSINDKTAGDIARKRLGKPPPTPEQAVMADGLNALYSRRDPDAAAAIFRQVLEMNPTHYGATFQLAKALDQAGKPSEARPLWEKVLKMAEGYKDQPTMDTARARLAAKQ